MQATLARVAVANSRPDRCACGDGMGFVKRYLTQNGYGAIPKGGITQQSAASLASYWNSGGARQSGLKRLSMSNPFDAPPGSVIIVAPGSPGVSGSSRTPGEIAVKGAGNSFWNDGAQSFGDRSMWSSGRGGVLGVYAPTVCASSLQDSGGSDGQDTIGISEITEQPGAGFKGCPADGVLTLRAANHPELDGLRFQGAGSGRMYQGQPQYLTDKYAIRKSGGKYTIASRTNVLDRYVNHK